MVKYIQRFSNWFIIYSHQFLSLLSLNCKRFVSSFFYIYKFIYCFFFTLLNQLIWLFRFRFGINWIKIRNIILKLSYYRKLSIKKWWIIRFLFWCNCNLMVIKYFACSFRRNRYSVSFLLALILLYQLNVQSWRVF